MERQSKGLLNKLRSPSTLEEHVSFKKIIIRVFLPFTLAYLLSELFRNINGVAGPFIQNDLAIDAEQLGSLTAIFFVAVAGSQLIVGVFLDRFGGRRTVSALLLFAALGSIAFSSGNLNLMYLGRFLIGFGVAGCWTAAFKVNSQWWPPEHLALANGAIIGLAGLGALAATLPTQHLLSMISWQEMFSWLAIVTLVISVFLWLAALDHPSDRTPSKDTFINEIKGFTVVIRNPTFVIFGPVSIICQGVWLSYQSLWSGAWLREVNELTPYVAASFLFLLAVCVIFGNLILSAIAGKWETRGGSVRAVAVTVCTGFVLVQMFIWTDAFRFSPYLWGVFGFFVAGPIMFYAVLSNAVPNGYAGRAVSLLNLFATLGGFVIQYMVGVIIEMWPVNAAGIYPINAHRSALGVVILAQILAFAWLAYRLRKLQKL